DRDLCSHRRLHVRRWSAGSLRDSRTLGCAPWRVNGPTTRLLGLVEIDLGPAAWIGGWCTITRRQTAERPPASPGGRLIRHARYFTLQLAERLDRPVVSPVRPAHHAAGRNPTPLGGPSPTHAPHGF